MIKSSLIEHLSPFHQDLVKVMQALCSEEGQKLILALRCDAPISKQELVEKTNMDRSRLNELLLLFTENRIIEFLADNRSADQGYLICGHCGIVAYMILTAMYILQKTQYTVSQFLVE